MNARQKAKKYKKMAERYKDKAEAWDMYLRRSRYNYGIYPRRYGTIETLKVAKWWDNRIPVEEEFFKKEIAMEFADCLLRDGYIDFKVDEEYNEYTMARKRKITATLYAAKGVYNDDNY